MHLLGDVVTDPVSTEVIGNIFSTSAGVKSDQNEDH